MKRTVLGLCAALLLTGSRCSSQLFAFGSDPDLEVTHIASLRAADSDESEPFAVPYDNASGLAIAQVNLAVYLVVANRRSYSVTVERYGAEVQAVPNGAWTPVYSIVTSGNFYAGVLPGPLTLQPIARDFETNALRPIPPKGTVAGWLLFEYPSDFKTDSDVNVRITLVDDRNDRLTFSWPQDVHRDGVEIGTKGLVKVGPPRDFVDVTGLALNWRYRLLSGQPTPVP